MGFGSLGISELLIIFVIVLVFFGPKRMPEVARSLGSAMREFRRSLNQIQRELEDADPTRELRKETKDILSRLPEEVRPGTSGAGRRTPASPGPPPSDSHRRETEVAPEAEPSPGPAPDAVPDSAPPDDAELELDFGPREPAEPRPDVSGSKPGNGSG
jgi:TatA/E family protein of Tat protein translocase